MKSLQDFPKVIKTERLELRFLEPTFDNAKCVFDIACRNKKHLVFMPWIQHLKSVEDELFWLNDCSKQFGIKWLDPFGIFVAGKCVGTVGFHDIHPLNDRLRLGEFAYWLDEKAVGNGYMTESVRALEKLAFLDFGFERIQIRCDSANTRSEAVMKRCGYTFESKIRHNMIDANGDIRDTLVYSKLREEYKQSSREGKYVN